MKSAKLSVENPSATLPAPLAGRRTGLVRRKELAVCHGILCIPDGAAIRVPGPGGAVPRFRRQTNSAAAGDTIWMRAEPTLHESNHAFEETEQSAPIAPRSGRIRARCLFSTSNYSCQRVVGAGQQSPLTGSWMHLEGLGIANGKVGLSGSHRTPGFATKNASTHLRAAQTSIRVAARASSSTQALVATWSDCDSHDNYDVRAVRGMGKTATGFGVHYQPPAPDHRPRVPLMAQLR